MKRLHSRAALAALAVFVLGAAGAAPAAELPRTHLVLANAIAVDADAGTATLPLHRGTAGGTTVWYIVTDSSDKSDAQRRGAVYAPLLADVDDGCAACVSAASERDGSIAYPAAPDFSASRVFDPGSAGFPPAKAQPGAVASGAYTPFVRIGGAVVNAPIVATGDAPSDVTTHRDTADRVVAIDTQKKTVTLLLARGFAGGKRVLYLSTEASDAGAAAIERATFVPALKAQSGVIPIDVVVNGATQGLAFAALHGNLAANATAANVSSLASPRNILASFPTGRTAAAYSPLWSAQPVVWAASAKRDTVLTSIAQISALGSALGGPGGKPIGPAGFVVNCPVVAYVDTAP